MSLIPQEFKVNREVKKGIHALSEVFYGLEHSPAIIGLFKTRERATHFLKGVHLRVEDLEGYMFVDPTSGHIVVSREYLLEGEPKSLYLDILHESVHVKQWLDGKDLYDRRYKYVERPTELEAYTVVVREAQRIGMARDEIAEYLAVPWISRKELLSLINRLALVK